ncbi:aldo/keto reductase [Terrisporobacter sp.]
MEYVTLNNGVKMPGAGFGVFQIMDQKACEDSVIAAIQAGYRLIDTAAIYGNEKAVGEAIKKCKVPRDDQFCEDAIKVRWELLEKEYEIFYD